MSAELTAIDPPSHLVLGHQHQTTRHDILSTDPTWTSIRSSQYMLLPKLVIVDRNGSITQPNRRLFE
jgi:hypothetical protein